MSEVYFPADHSADEWRAMARRKNDAVAESWDRCDNDGFLSQWAGGVMARLYDRLADHAENGGKAELQWPFMDGEPVADYKWVDGRYGASVLINPGKDGFFWNPSKARKGAARLAADERKGVVWGAVRAEVVVFLAGGGISVSPRSERRKGAELEIIEPVNQRLYGRDH